MKNLESNKGKVKIIADECVDKSHIDFLISLGHEVTTVADLHLCGLSNGALLNFAVKDKKIFLTEDQDFCNIILYPPHLSHGIIVLKTSPEVEDTMHSVLKDLLSNLSPSELNKTLAIVDHNKYRIRKE